MWKFSIMKVVVHIRNRMQKTFLYYFTFFICIIPSAYSCFNENFLGDYYTPNEVHAMTVHNLDEDLFHTHNHLRLNNNVPQQQLPQSIRTITQEEIETEY